MKYIYFISIAIITFCNGLSAQTCLQNGIIFFTQQEIDDFAMNYPGCTEIGGDLSFDGSFFGGIVNLNGLSQLTSIGGSLNIIDLYSIVSLNGLQNITSIGGSLKLSECVELLSLLELENITSIGGDLEVSSCYELPNLRGLQNITSIGGDLIISSLNQITHFQELENITQVPGDIEITACPQLASLQGLQNITSIGGSLYIWSPGQITNLQGLENITNIPGNLQISYGTQLTSLQGLHNLTSVAGRLRISYNEITNFQGLENLTSISGNLGIWYNQALSSLTGLENIAPSGISNLRVFNNPNLSICSLPNICNYLASGGVSEIYGNATNCNDEFEIQAICLANPCPSTVIAVNDQPIPDGLYQTNSQINSIGTVPNGGNVNFKAGQLILLNNGFSVDTNADFSAEIEDCGM